MSAPDRCEPPAELRGVDGVHWLDRGRYGELLTKWEASSGCWFTYSEHHSPERAGEHGWRYLAPVTHPAEVEALREEVRRLRGAATTAADLFQWYADEHVAAGKTDKAKRNQDAADALRTALKEPTP